MLKSFWQKNKIYLLTSFFIPFLLMAIMYLTIGIYPGSSRSIMASDAFSQFSNFHASFRNALLGKQGFLYTWNAALGLNYLSLISYYLGGFFTPLVLFFPNQFMPDALYFLTLLKIGASGLSFWFYAKHSFKISNWSQATLAICYALMSFTLVHSELVMWLDAYIYLPLVIWGIDRLIQLAKPKLLFISYFMLFFTSFYFGFMIGVFSVLYFLIQLLRSWKKNKKKILPYAITSLLAGGASMIIILPAILDLHSNGEELTQITATKTEATGPWDFLIKNMISVYDTTKYGSIPFIYIGLVPLILAIFYFCIKEISFKDKLLYACLIGILIASFYFVPFNLFWHGMHAPNMFLFRYAFLLSFVVVMLAGLGWEKLSATNKNKIFFILIILCLVFTLTYLFNYKAHDYLKLSSLLLTLAFLIVYGIIYYLELQKKFTLAQLAALLLVIVTVEMGINANGMLRGILHDWNYASRSLYTQPYKAIKTLVDQTKADNQNFYRLENLDPVSSNDGLNYGYSSLSMFSSIRNRHTLGYMDSLGFRSRGTSLNIRYPNNTLLMDNFVSMKYNIAKNPISKYGFKEIATSNGYHLYKNQNVLPLGFLADPDINNTKHYDNDNLANQTNLINALAQTSETFFQFEPITMTASSNVTVKKDGLHTKFTEKKGNTAKDVTWQVSIPAHTQAYLSLYPSDFNQLESSTATIYVGDKQQESQIGINGQYYNLGYYDHATVVTFTASFYGTPEISFQDPQVVSLDTQALQRSIDQIKKNGVEMKTSKHGASATINSSKKQKLVTTIPYDGGWHAKINGKKVTIDNFQNAFVSLDIPAGKYQLELNYLPSGFIMGVILFVSCIFLFVIFNYYYEKKRKI
ncbi:MAG TPA: YfhO family protein [Tetragenococcus sp.]|nr:YfhO family protein [Tetragenococcus sp.]